jgi:hypothetical protein
MAGRRHSDILAAMLLPCGEHQTVIGMDDNNRISHCRFRLAFGPTHDANLFVDVIVAFDTWLLIVGASGKHDKIVFTYFTLTAQVPSLMDEMRLPKYLDC